MKAAPGDDPLRTRRNSEGGRLRAVDIREAVLARERAHLQESAQRRLHNARDDTSLMKIRFPDIAGWAHVALSATL